MEPVLLVMDLQNEFCNPRGAKYLAGVEEILPRVATAIRTAHAAQGRVIFTRELHPPEGSGEVQSPPCCVEGTWGAALVPEMPVGEGDLLLTRTAPNAFQGTNLDRLLGERSRLFLTGIATEVGVLQTASEAVMRGINVTILRDCIFGVTRDGERSAMYHLEEMLQVPLLLLSRLPALLGCS